MQDFFSLDRRRVWIIIHDTGAPDSGPHTVYIYDLLNTCPNIILLKERMGVTYNRGVENTHCPCCVDAEVKTQPSNWKISYER